MTRVRGYFMRRLYEASTTVGGVKFIGGLVGFGFSDDEAGAVISVIIAFVGALQMFLPDKFPKPS